MNDSPGVRVELSEDTPNLIDPRPAPAVKPAARADVLAARRRRRKRDKPVLTALLMVSPFVIALVVWEVLVRYQVFPSYLFPGPGEVWNMFYQDTFVNHTLFVNVGDSLERAVVGYIPGVGGGLLLGLLMGLNRRVAQFFRAPIVFLNAIPGLAWTPLAILWFGIGYGSITFIIFLSAIFPILVNTYSGIQTIPSQYINVARLNEVSPLQMLRTVLIPGALPSILNGIRLGAAYGFRGMVGAEMIASSSGLGFMITQARQYLDTATVIIGMITIGVLWFAIERLILRPIEKATVERWGMVRV